MGLLGGDHQAGYCGCGGRGFNIPGSFLLRLPRSPFRGCCGFELRILRAGRLPGGGYYRLLGGLRDRLRRGINMLVGWWSRGSLDDTPPSDDVVPPLAQVHLLGRGTGPMSFRSGRLDSGDALSAAFGRLLRKSRLRLLPLHTTTVIRCVIFPAARTLRLLPGGTANTGEVGVPTSVVPRCVSAVTLRVAERCQRLHYSGPLGANYDSTDNRKPQSSVSDRTFDTSDPRATDTIKCGAGGRFLAWTGSRRPDSISVTP